LKSAFAAAVTALFLFAVGAQAAVQTFYADDFESYNVGDHPAVWGEISGQDDDVVTDIWAASGTKSLMSTSSDLTGIKHPVVNLADIGASPAPEYFAYQGTIAMEATAESSGIIGFFFVDPRNPNQVAAENAVAFQLDGKVMWYGREDVQIGTWTPGTATAATVRVEINARCKTADVWINGTLMGHNLEAWKFTIPATSEYGIEVTLDKWGFGLADNFAGAGPGRVFIDDVLLSTFVPVIDAEIVLKPETLNLKSNGRVVTVFIGLAKCYTVRCIDVSTVYIYAGSATPVNAFLRPTSVANRDRDRQLERMVKFPRQALQAMLSPGENVEVFVGGYLKTGEAFLGKDTVRVINPGKGKGHGKK